MCSVQHWSRTWWWSCLFSPISIVSEFKYLLDAASACHCPWMQLACYLEVSWLPVHFLGTPWVSADLATLLHVWLDDLVQRVLCFCNPNISPVEFVFCDAVLFATYSWYPRVQGSFHLGSPWLVLLRVLSIPYWVNKIRGSGGVVLRFRGLAFPHNTRNIRNYSPTFLWEEPDGTNSVWHPE